MKNEPSPYQSPGAAPVAKHQYQHAVPTVIHDPEQDMTLLGRWMHRAMKDPVKFWTWVGGAVAGVLALVIAANLFSSTGRRGSEVWSKLEGATSADEQIELAKANPDSTAAPWALYSAASQLYRSGVDDLPNNADVALQTLKKSVDLFEQIAKDEPKDSAVAPAAAFGLARALEARNELPKAIDQYKLVADTWPDSPEAADAKKLADALQKPDAVAFYRDLYAYKPTKVSLPPLGTETLDFPVVPSPPDSPIDGSLLIPPPPSSTEEPKAEDEPKAAEEAEAAEEPKAEAEPAEEPKVEAEPAEEPKVEAEPAEEPKAAEEPKVEEPGGESAPAAAAAESPEG